MLHPGTLLFFCNCRWVYSMNNFPCGGMCVNFRMDTTPPFNPGSLLSQRTVCLLSPGANTLLLFRLIKSGGDYVHNVQSLRGSQGDPIS